MFSIFRKKKAAEPSARTKKVLSLIRCGSVCEIDMEIIPKVSIKDKRGNVLVGSWYLSCLTNRSLILNGNSLERTVDVSLALREIRKKIGDRAGNAVDQLPT